MSKLIAAINMTLDGFCDHTAVIADDDLHRHYNELFQEAGTVLFGRVTYQLMESAWPALVTAPSGNLYMDEFARLIDAIHKVVFSSTLKTVNWKNTRLATVDLEKEVLSLKGQPGKDILAGSPGIITQLMQLKLIDEFQLCIQPIVLGHGLVLFKNIVERTDLRLLKTTTLESEP